MPVYGELLAFQTMSEIKARMEEFTAHAREGVPDWAVAILGEVQGILCDSKTNDFKKVDAIVQLFINNGLDTGNCHDF